MKTSPQAFSVIPLASLKVGVTLRAPILEARDDDRDVLLLAQQTRLTSNLLTLLERRGVRFVRVHSSDLSQFQGGSVSPARGAAAAPRLRPARASQSRSQPATPWKISPSSYLHEVRRPGATPYDDHQQERIAQMVGLAAAAIGEVHREMVLGAQLNHVAVSDLNRRCLEQIAADIDVFLDISLRPLEYSPSRHSTQTSMLAMSIGTVMGLSAAQLQQLGMGCILHDVGMLKINFDFTKRELDSTDLLELTKHPIATMELIGTNAKVPHAAKMVAYQMHERMNGSGYPRHRIGPQIHPLARIAAVADTYLALVSPRPQRPPLSPYQAVEHILFATREGQFEPRAVRGLLHAVSMFPIGSLVELSDGRTAKVLRSNRDNYMHPVVALDSGEVLDLSESAHLAVTRPAGKGGRLEAGG